MVHTEIQETKNSPKNLEKRGKIEEFLLSNSKTWYKSIVIKTV